MVGWLVSQSTNQISPCRSLACSCQRKLEASNPGRGFADPHACWFLASSQLATGSGCSELTLHQKPFANRPLVTNFGADLKPTSVVGAPCCTLFLEATDRSFKLRAFSSHLSHRVLWHSSFFSNRGRLVYLEFKMDMTPFNPQIAGVANIRTYDSASDEEEDDEEYEDDPEVTLRPIVKSKTINFSIRANYTNWAPREAFRELVQNWYS